MANWQDINQKFTPELEQKWIKRGFNYEQTDEWINIVCLTPFEFKLAVWLRDIKSQDIENFADAQWIKANADLEKLREEFANQNQEEKINAQEWLDNNYPQEERENTKELYIDNKNLTGELDLSEFTNLKEVYISYFVDEDELEIKDKEKYKIIKLVNAQEYLLENYPKKEDRKKHKELDISSKNLEGSLKLEGFTNLQKVNCSQNQLVELDLSDCSKLIEVDCWSNQLSKLEFISLPHLQILNAWENKLAELHWDGIGSDLTVLSLSNNNFSEEQNLGYFSKFTNLEELYLGTDKKERIKKILYNKFTGSLKNLEALTKLEKLQIEATDVDDGLECLSESLERIVHWGSYYHGHEERFKVKKIEEILEDYMEGEEQNYYNYKKWKKDRNDWKEKGFKDEELKCLEEAGVKMNDHKFADYLRENKEYIKNYEIKKNDVDAQEWLKHFYPSEISKEIKEISINNNKILGFLKLDGEGFERLKKITIRCKNLGQIELIDLFELEDFRANPCQLTKLTIKNCPNIENLNVANNLLTKLDFLKNLGEEKNKLKFLSIHSNDFSEKDLSCFSELINLEQLYIDNCDREKFSRGKYNKFKGSLKPLKNLKKLKYLSISNTDIDSGLEYLPESIRRIGCVSKWKRNENSKNSEKGIEFFKIRRKLEKQAESLTEMRKKEIYELEKKEKTPDYIINGYYIFSTCDKKNSGEENLNLLASSSALYEEWGIRGFTRQEIKKWISIGGFSPHEAPLVKEWEERNFACGDVENWRKKGLESDDHEFAYYLKLKEKKEGDIDSLNLYTLWKDHEKAQRSKSSQLVKTVAEIPLELKKNYETKDDDSGKQLKKVDYTEIYPAKIPGEKFSWQRGDEAIDLPTKLYNIKRYQPDKTRVEDIIKATVEKTELDSDIKSYAILSYVCGPYECEQHKDCRKCGNYIYKGLKKSLIKVAKAIEIINEKKYQEFKSSISESSTSKAIEEKVKNFSTLDYLWIDQFCIDQSNPHEKADEIHKMHQYYSNAEVTLIPIDSEVKEEIKFFNDSFNELHKFLGNTSYKKGKGVSNAVNREIEGKTKRVVESSLGVLEKVVNSKWFERSWTFQEGWLSKRTLFMFNDYLVDGRFLALMWKLSHEFATEGNNSQQNNEVLWKNAIFWEEEEKGYDSLEKFWEAKFSNEKVATPIGWVYHKDNYNQRDIVYLSLNEALKEMKNRKRSVAIDGIYSILSLLPYGGRVNIEYSKDPNHQYTKNELRKALTDVMKAAINAGYAEPLTWHGPSSRMPGLCWTPHINNDGSTSIEDYIRVDCIPERIKFKPEGMEVIGSEYVVGHVYDKDSDKTAESDEKSVANKNFFTRKVGVEIGELEEKEVELIGTKEVLEVVEKGNILVVFSKGEWKSERPFALLVTKGEDNIRHRVGLVELSPEGEKEIESRVAKRKKLIIGLDKHNSLEKDIITYLKNNTMSNPKSSQNQDYQTQIQIPPK